MIHEKNNYPNFKVGKFIITKIPYWKEVFNFPGTNIGFCGSWADEWIPQIVRIEFHTLCKDFNYKIRLVPDGPFKNIGVERSWYTSDLFGYGDKWDDRMPDKVFDTIDDAIKSYAENYPDIYKMLK